MDPYGRILGFLHRSRCFSIQVASQLYSQGWMCPVPDPLLLRKSGSAGNRIRTSGSVAKNSDHYTTKAVSTKIFFFFRILSQLHPDIPRRYLPWFCSTKARICHHSSITSHELLSIQRRVYMFPWSDHWTSSPVGPRRAATGVWTATCLHSRVTTVAGTLCRGAGKFANFKHVWGVAGC
jgi:hypothetical protein